MYKAFFQGITDDFSKSVGQAGFLESKSWIYFLNLNKIKFGKMLPYKHVLGEICVCNNLPHKLQENAYRKVFGLKKFLDERPWTPLLNMEFWGISKK